MRHKQLKLSAVLLLGLGLIGLQAQETIPTSGGNATGTGGSVSYTVGQIVYTTTTGTNGSAVHGVQQPYETLVVTAIKEAKGINLLFAAYPNPTTNKLILKIDASTTLSIQLMSYQLYDITGKLLQNQKVEGNETSISMEGLVSATYFLKITDNKREVKTFKIIKTQ